MECIILLMIQRYLFWKQLNQFGGIIMKAHKYWSIGAIVTMVGTFYTGYKGLGIVNVRVRNKSTGF